jgi:hypothetical protein
MTRTKILDAARAAVTTDRQTDYGSPENSFQGIADYWNTRLHHRGLLAQGAKLDAAEVGILLMLMKVARQEVSPGKADHYVDMGGYAACAGEIATAPVQSELPFEPKCILSGFSATQISHARAACVQEKFPDPPPGRKWHNPDNLTPTEVGAAEGWRLLLKDEPCSTPGEFYFNGGWSEGRKDLIEASGFSSKPTSCSPYTCRTKEPLPQQDVFPDPPSGRKWHNPERLTPAQVGIAEGWRLCLEDETADLPDEVRLSTGEWKSSGAAVFRKYAEFTSTYRTKAPLPL